MAATDTTRAEDPELVARARTGDRHAFEELARRHAHPAWRMALAVTGDVDTAAAAVRTGFVDAFRTLHRIDEHVVPPFRLLVVRATRAAAIEVAPVTSTANAANASVRVFRDLPERWRSALWLTAVEGGTSAQAGYLLDLPADETAKLARRARAGIRERFLRAERDAAPDECKPTIDRLSAYNAQLLSTDELAQVEDHLSTCESCRERVLALADLRAVLRPLVAPVAAGLVASTVDAWLAWWAAEGRQRRAAVALVPFASTAPGWMERAVAGIAAGVITLGLIGASIIGNDDDDGPGLAASAGSESAAGSATADAAAKVQNAADLAPAAAEQAGRIGRAVGTGTSSTVAAAATPAAAPAAAPAATPNAPAAPQASTIVSVAIDPGGLPIGVRVGTDGLGLQLGTLIVGNPPPQPAPGLSLSIGGVKIL